MNQALDDLLKRRKPILNAKRLLTNQTFRDIYRTDTLAIGQRLKILSLTILFSDLKVNIASRVQGLAASRSIVVTEPVVGNAQASALLENNG